MGNSWCIADIDCLPDFGEHLGSYLAGWGIGNLVHSSVNIKKEVLSAGALQPVIGLLRCLMMHLFEFCINLIRHITTDVYFLL
jgi:hypothetical protein